jgi:hypothetical protein
MMLLSEEQLIVLRLARRSENAKQLPMTSKPSSCRRSLTIVLWNANAIDAARISLAQV